MCVIVIAKNGRPSADMVQACFEQNRDGAGIAWPEGDEICWKKGIRDLEEIKELVAKAPLPFIAHFRISTVGGTTRSLTHPFLMDADCSLALEGRGTTPLVFHNGTWAEWRRVMFETSIGASLPIPKGRWSDSRAMAWLAHFYGLGLFEVINEKVAVLGPKMLEVFGDNWTIVDGIGYASNNGWASKMPKGATPAASLECQHCKRMTCVGNCREGKDPRLEVVSETTQKFSEALDAALVEGEDDAPFEAAQFDPKKHPFWLACELYGKGELSKNQYKKAFKFHSIRMKEQKKAEPPSTTLH